MIGDGDSESILLYLVRRGSCRIEQDGRSCVLGPGELATHDSSRPSVFESVDAMDVAIFNFPKWLLGVRGDVLARRSALKMSPGRGRSCGSGPRSSPAWPAPSSGPRSPSRRPRGSRTCSSACCGPSPAPATGMPRRRCARRRCSSGCAGTRWSTCTTPDSVRSRSRGPTSSPRATCTSSSRPPDAGCRRGSASAGSNGRWPRAPPIGRCLDRAPSPRDGATATRRASAGPSARPTDRAARRRARRAGRRKALARVRGQGASCLAQAAGSRPRAAVCPRSPTCRAR